MIMSAAVKDHAISLGFDLVGICEVQEPPHWAQYKEWVDKGWHGSMSYLKDHLDLKRDPRSLLPSAQSVIMVGLNYNQPNPYHANHPRIARYALGRDYHKVVRGKLKQLQNWLHQEYPGSVHRVCVDSAPIMERDFARLAGLGWFGKNTMIINSQRGSWFFLGVLLTSVELEPDKPSSGGCGTCHACIDACPTGAIVHQDGRWQVNATRCISYLTIEHEAGIEPELAAKIGEWTFGCDVCQEVCPFNQARESQPLRAKNTHVPDFANRRNWPSLTELVVMSQQDWDRASQGSPVRRTGLSGIQRNALINLVNEQQSRDESSF